MTTKIVFSKAEFPLGAALTCGLTQQDFDIGEETCMKIGDLCSLTQSHSISRHIARLHPHAELYPSNILNRTEVDNWLTLTCGPAAIKSSLGSFVAELNNALQSDSFLVGNSLSIADLEAFAVIYKNQQLLDNSTQCKMNEWFDRVEKKVRRILKTLPVPQIKKQNANPVKKTDEGGKFAALPGAEKGKVVVRFPPEASGYLHIGHAKAALLNQYYQKEFEGKLIMRFDDTNPAKENAEFEKVILEDLKLLEIEPDLYTHTSDLFPKMLELCENLIKSELAYADDTDPETMKKEREERKSSKNRDNSVEANLKMWSEMKSGTDYGQQYCVRAKMDMSSPNGCLRDPTIYRCKNESHVRTGTQYKAYPTYDFACPIVDSIEGVTHALRTTEYHDRDDQYKWFIEKLNLRPVVIYDYSRLNMNNTVLSKRKLAWFVKEGLVDGWDDPRFPTVRGILRRGMTVEGLKEFIISQGSSRSVVNMEWDKIWSFNKKVVDKDACRYTALEGELVPVTVSNAQVEIKDAQKHPKDPSKGMKKVWLGPKIFIEAVDALLLKEGETATFINWGNLMVKKINKSGDRVTSVEAETNLLNTDFKKTVKLTWLAETDKAPWTGLVCVYFDHLISKGVLAKDEDFKQFIGQNTLREVTMVGDDSLKSLNAGDIIQLQRKGFFRIDKRYTAGADSSVIAFYIPDGHTKEQTGTTKPTDKQRTAINITKEESSGKNTNSAVDIHDKIIIQGDKIRTLKAAKAEKGAIKAEVEILLVFKKEFLTVTGENWNPDIDISGFAPEKVDKCLKVERDSDAVTIHNSIKNKGDKIRELKAAKATKETIKAEVDVLLELKRSFKDISGQDWKPDIDIDSFSHVREDDKSANHGPTGSMVVDNKVNKHDDKVKDIIDKYQNVGQESDAVNIHNRIKKQGDKIRDLKAANGDKGAIKAEVDVLLNLKKTFKCTTGQDWKPDIVIDNFSHVRGDDECTNVVITDAIAIHNKINRHGELVKEMKAALQAEIDSMLRLKSDFKNATGNEWKSDIIIGDQTPLAGERTLNTTNEIHAAIKQQGDKIRYLKTSKADKNIIKAEVDILLDLKKNYKSATGEEWKPDAVGSLNSKKPSDEISDIPHSQFGLGNVGELCNKISAVCNKLQALKTSKAENSVIKDEADILLDLKSHFKKTVGEDWSPDFKFNMPNITCKASPAKKATHISTKANKNVNNKVNKESDTQGKKQTRLCMEVKKLDNIAEWYAQVITKAEMCAYYNVSGCYILRPWSYSIWEVIQNFLNCEIKKMGVDNCYFPLFVAKDALEKEKDHIEGFFPEVAWVTKSGDTDMAEPIAIRPTSETVMYPSIATWVQSRRDLPLKLNQWSNIVRWEFKQPTPFLRSREFLWQEGHTCFANEKEALDDVYAALDIYTRVYEDLLAVPVIRGRKTVKESFAGGVFTTTVEAFVTANGRAIQGGTSHHLGQNFSKMFDITFEDPETKEVKYAYQNSWGMTTRTIGVMIMVHGDDKGLVLPPRVSKIQVVVVPVGITAKTTAEEKQKLINMCHKLSNELGDIRSYCDDRDNVTPGWKFNHWELKGVPIRIEIGPKEMTSESLCIVRRDTGQRLSLPHNSIQADIKQLINTIHNDMFTKAKVERDKQTATTTDWNQFVKNLDQKKITLSPFCGEEKCEVSIKQDSARGNVVIPGEPSMGAKTLCMPFDQQGSVEGLKCIYPTCSKPPICYTLFGRSY